MLKLIKRYEGMKFGNIKYFKPFSFTKIINNYNNSNLKYSSMFLFSTKLNKDIEAENKNNSGKSDDTSTNSDISSNNLSKNEDKKIENEVHSEDITNKINTNTSNLAINQSYMTENKKLNMKYLINSIFSPDKEKHEMNYIKYLNNKLENFKFKKSSGISNYNNLRLGKYQKPSFNIFSLKNKEMNLKKYDITNNNSVLNQDKNKLEKLYISMSKTLYYYIRRKNFRRNFNRLKIRQLLFSILIFMLFFYLCFGNFKKITSKINLYKMI